MSNFHEFAVVFGKTTEKTVWIDLDKIQAFGEHPNDLSLIWVQLISGEIYNIACTLSGLRSLLHER